MKLKSALIMLLSCIGILQAQEMEMMFVGTYTDGGSKGVYSYRFNQETGEAVVLDSLEMTNPSYLTISRDQRLMYVVSETHDDKASLNIVRITKNLIHSFVSRNYYKAIVRFVINYIETLALCRCLAC